MAHQRLERETDVIEMIRLNRMVLKALPMLLPSDVTAELKQKSAF